MARGGGAKTKREGGSRGHHGLKGGGGARPAGWRRRRACWMETGQLRVCWMDGGGVGQARGAGYGGGAVLVVSVEKGEVGGSVRRGARAREGFGFWPVGDGREIRFLKATFLEAKTRHC